MTIENDENRQRILVGVTDTGETVPVLVDSGGRAILKW